MSLDARAVQLASDILAKTDLTDDQKVQRALRLLAKFRTARIQNEVVYQNGTIVQDGPFIGLDFMGFAAEGCHVPKLLGCYEQPLHQAIERAIALGYADVINIGCAEGYYAVGLAQRMPATIIHAYDLDPRSRDECAALAAKNGVAHQVRIGELFTHADFQNFAQRKGLVLCDIEGAEYDLLDPDAAPALRQLDIIVETHVGMRRTMVEDLTRRFAMTHEIEVIGDDGMRELIKQPAWFKKLPSLDQLLAIWEWRNRPTPWLVMIAR